MKSICPFHVGQNIRRLRGYRDYTRKYVADYLEIHLNTYSKIENGQFKVLNIELINKIANLLEVSPGQILFPDLNQIKLSQIGKNRNKKQKYYWNTTVSSN